MREMVDRNNAIVDAIMAGARPIAVARKYGVSRDRIRQIFKRLVGVRPCDLASYRHWRRRTFTAADVNTAMRTTGTLHGAAKALGTTHVTLRRMYPTETGRWIFHWRDVRRCAARARAIGKLQAFYAMHGRAPTMAELGCSRRRGQRIPSLPRGAGLYILFGGIGEAFDRAGIPRNPRGNRSYQLAER